MIQIPNFDTSPRQVVTYIYFFVHMMAKHISAPTEPGLTDLEESRSCSCYRSQAQVEQKIWHPALIPWVCKFREL